MGVQRLSRIGARTLAIVVGVGLIVVAVFGLQRGHPPEYRGQIRNNFRQIALAMHNYADKHGALPPPTIYSADGKPLLSWRVLLLPYIEHEKLYEKFKLDESWDSAHNFALLSEMPPVYETYRFVRSEPHMTTYRVFVGRGAAFEGPRGISLGSFDDGLDNTLLIVEAAEAVPWTKPAELAYSPEGSLPLLGSPFSGELFRRAR